MLNNIEDNDDVYDRLTDQQLYDAAQAFEWQDEVSDDLLYHAAQIFQRQHEIDTAQQTGIHHSLLHKTSYRILLCIFTQHKLYTL